MYFNAQGGLQGLVGDGEGATEVRESEDVQVVGGMLLRSPSWTEVCAIKGLHQVIPFSL